MDDDTSAADLLRQQQLAASRAKLDSLAKTGTAAMQLEEQRKDEVLLNSMPVALAYAFLVLAYSLGGEQSHQTLTQACAQKDELRKKGCRPTERHELVAEQRVPVCKQLLQDHGPRSGHWVGWPYVHDASTVAHCRRCACAEPAVHWYGGTVACAASRADTRALASKARQSLTFENVANYANPWTWGVAAINAVIGTLWRATAADNMMIFVLLCAVLLPFTKQSAQPMNLVPAVLCAGAIVLVVWQAEQIKAFADHHFFVSGMVDHLTDSAVLYAITLALAAGMKTGTGLLHTEVHLHPLSWSAETIIAALWLCTLLVHRSCETLERTLGSGFVQWLVDKTSETWGKYFRSNDTWRSSTNTGRNGVIVSAANSYISHLTTTRHARMLADANRDPTSHGGSELMGVHVNDGLITLTKKGRSSNLLQAPPMCYQRLAFFGPQPQGGEGAVQHTENRRELNWSLKLVAVYDLQKVARSPTDIGPRTYLLAFLPMAKNASPTGYSRRAATGSDHLPQNWTSIVLPAKSGYLPYTLDYASVLIKERNTASSYYNPRLGKRRELNKNKLVYGGGMLGYANPEDTVYVEAAVPLIQLTTLQANKVQLEVIYNDLEAAVAKSISVEQGYRNPVVDCAICLAIDEAKKRSKERARLSGGVTTKLELPTDVNCRRVMQRANAAFDDGLYVPAKDRVR